MQTCACFSTFVSGSAIWAAVTCCLHVVPERAEKREPAVGASLDTR